MQRVLWATSSLMDRGRPALQRVFQVSGALADRGYRVFNDANDRLRIKLALRKEQSKLWAKSELVVVYDGIGACIWRALMPSAELHKHFDHRSRFLPDRDSSFWWSLGAGGALGSLLIFVLFLTVMHPFIAAFFGVPMGSLIGGGVGWAVSPRFKPKPIWIVRRSSQTEKDDKTGETRELVTIDPMKHTFMGFYEGYEAAQDIVAEALAHSANGMNGDKEPPRIPLRIITASGVYETIQGKDARVIFASSGDRMRKFALMGIGGIAIAFFGLLILFAIAMSE